MLKIFFDTSVLFSAIYSRRGGSNQICRLVKDEIIKGFTTQSVISELQANISKFSKKTKISPVNFIADHHFVVRSEIAEREIKHYKTIVAAKDAHIVAGALFCKCEYLLTLDKKHLDNKGVKNKFSEVIITSPKEFLQHFRK